MALTPRIKIELTESQKAIADSLEERIDGFIKVDFDGRGDSRVSVEISDFSRPYNEGFSKVMDEITRRYNEAGWNVSYTYRGGDNKKYAEFVELTPKKQRPI